MASLTAIKAPWTNVFPQTFTTKKTSVMFTKKLFATAVSNITYIRGFFPESCFIDKSVEGIPLKVLRDGVHNNNVKKFIEWIRGIFEALDKQYLKTAMLGVYLNPEDPDTVIESYAFRFFYHDNDVSVTMNMDNSFSPKSVKTELADSSVDGIKKATLELLRMLLTAASNLPPLPATFMITMKLSYYDEMTPDDYMPPSFKTSHFVGFRIPSSSSNVRVGAVNTSYHGVKMLLQAESKAELHATGCIPKRSGQVSTPLHMASPNANEDVENGDVLEKPYTVKCPCGGTKDDGVMIMCAECGSWQHAICFRILEASDAPEQHFCDNCAAESACTDVTLSGLTNRQKQSLCIFRRALFLCTEMERMKATDLAQALDLQLTIAQSLMNRLEKENAVATPANPKNRKFGKIVNSEYIQEVLLPRHFSIHNADNDSTTNGVSPITKRRRRF